MYLTLPPLYHWSPLKRHEAIRSQGLQPYSPPPVDEENWPGFARGFGCICLGLTPSSAWGLSGDMDHMSEIEEWDLWQVNLADNDEVRVRAEYGPQIKEIRVFNPIPPDRLWWVATRS
jgi:hypothetical protein